MDDGKRLVVVSINNQIGVFDYMYLGGFGPEYSVSGIVGRLGLVLTLKCVQENIGSLAVIQKM